MKKTDFSLLILITCCLLTLLSGCQINASQNLPPAPILSPTPFQPIPPTATVTPPPTATLTFTPQPTLTETMKPTSTDSPEPTEADTTAPEEDQSFASVTVPILLYHHISDTIDTQYNVQPETFAAQMKWLHDNGYQTVTIADVASAIRKNKSLPNRPVVITFDDGYLDVYQNAYPVMQEYDYVATFYIIANTVDTRKNLSTKKLLNLIQSGWEIGSHSMTHADLNENDQWETEIVGSKNLLEEKLGVKIETFAYPYGLAKPSVIAYTIDSGYIAAVGLGSSVIQDGNSLYYLSRKEVKSWYDLDFFEDFMPWSN